MTSELILDTGALVSLLDRRQPQHRSCLQLFEGWKGPIVSTEAVLTEASHLLGRVPGGREACVEFFLTGAVTLVPSSAESLRRCHRLMIKYADLPMDFADATLVVLAEDLETELVFTTDRRDFTAYRMGKGTPFRVLPEGRS